MSTILDSLKKSSHSRGDTDKNTINNFSFADNNNDEQSKVPVFLLLLLLTLALLYFGYQYLFSETIYFEKSPIAKSPTPVINTEQTPVKSKLLIGKNTTNKIEKPNSREVKNILQKEPDKNLQVKQINSTEINRSTFYNDKSFQNLNRPLNKQTDIINNIKDPIKQKKSTRLNERKNIKQNRSTLPQYKLAYQLPFTIRKDLPELILNIHVYDKNANNRIAIINGEKFEVGTLIGDDVLVKEIVLEGVVLEFKNTTFLLPKL